MKTLKLSIALAMSFAGIVYANVYLENSVKHVDLQVYSVSVSESMDNNIIEQNALDIHAFTTDTENTDAGKDNLVDCNDPMDDLCDI